MPLYQFGWSTHWALWLNCMYSVGKPAYMQVAMPFVTGSMARFTESFATQRLLASRKARKGRKRSVVGEWASTSVYRMRIRFSSLMKIFSLVRITPPTRYVMRGTLSQSNSRIYL